MEYRNGGGEDELFWVGVVQTCHSIPNWRTITVRSGHDDDYLHNEMYQLGDDGTEPSPAVEQDPTQPKLNAIAPGGNPFDRIKGVYAPKCFLQALNFEQQAVEVMSKDTRYRSSCRGCFLHVAPAWIC